MISPLLSSPLLSSLLFSPLLSSPLFYSMFIFLLTVSPWYLLLLRARSHLALFKVCWLYPMATCTVSVRRLVGNLFENNYSY